MDILDMYGENKDLARLTYSKPFQLVDLNQVSDELYRDELWAAIAELPMKWVNLYQDLNEMLIPLVKFFTAAQAAGAGKTISISIEYLLRVVGCDDLDGFLAKMAKELPIEAKEEVMTAAEFLEQRGMQRGREQGVLEGVAQGAHQSKEAIARNLLAEKSLSL